MNRTHAFLVALSLLPLPGTATATGLTKFDLICQGTVGLLDDKKPWRGRYSIDLDADEWCLTANCGSRTEQIARVSSSEIVLRDTPSDQMIVNRLNGTITTRMRGLVNIDVDAECSAAPFTPAAKAKF